MDKSYMIVKKPIWWYDTTKLYFYWCYNFDELNYKIGPLGEARAHKFIFRESEIEELRQKHPDFDKIFELEEVKI